MAGLLGPEPQLSASKLELPVVYGGERFQEKMDI